MSRYTLVNIAFLSSIALAIFIDQRIDISFWWYIAIVHVYLAICAYGSSVMSFQFFLFSKTRAFSSDAIAVTFDDGPIPGKTNRILDILKQHDVPAAFFCIGNRVNDNQQLMQRIHAEGHLIGNHSYWHKPTFDLMPASRVEKELSDTDEAIRAQTGVIPRLFRPPYGVTNPMVAKAVRKRNYTVVGWSVRSFDTMAGEREELWARITKSLKGGDIVLFHDYSEVMIDVLPDFLKHVNDLGLKIVRVDKLLNEKAYA